MKRLLILMPLLPLFGGCLLDQGTRPEGIPASQPAEEHPVSQPEEEGPKTKPVKVLVSERCDEPTDLWSRLRGGFKLSSHDHPRIQPELQWYLRHPHYLDRVADRASPYLYIMVEEAERRGIPTEIALLPVVESAFQPFAYSHGRAAGLWQFVPGTGRRFGLRQTWWYDGRRDVAEATRAAYDYLEYLSKLFDGDWLNALAAYNSGEGTVLKAIRRNKRRNKPTDFWSLDLPEETRGYVPKLLAIATVIDNPPAKGVIIPTIEDKPFLATVEVDSQIDLDLAAELAEISLEDIYLYNPGFNRWATDPDGPHKLLIPVDKRESFLANLAEYPQGERIRWQRHTIREGEVLGTIADKYATTVTLLKRVNNIRGNTIRAGKKLIVPVARKSLWRYSLTANQRLQRTKSVQRSGTKLTYEVQDGDTLWDIARKYGVGVRQLAKWNGMAPRDNLKPGVNLVIWLKESGKANRTSAVNPATFQHPFEQNTHRRIAYTVRSGDSLARISEKFRVSVSKLKKWNKSVADSKYLQPGQRLTLYVDVRKQSGTI